jgi:membrane protein DedA with SNARE-associated domain
MLDWISDTIWSIVTYVPAIFVDQNSPSFEAVRAMFGLLLIALIVYVIAMMPRFAAWTKKVSARKTDKT